MAFNSIRLHQATRNDDISAFERLFKKYYAALVNYAYGFVKDMDASEEIVQDFFYNYWKNRKEIKIRLSVKSYLYRAIRNNSLKYLEAQAVRRRYAEKVLETARESTPENNTGIEYNELNNLIEETLDELPERCRQIFRMSRYEDLKYEEIASRLSVSVKTVEANIGKALKLLRERLGKYYRTDTD
jgi:RNA polymerase sigma-70 factor, ECF subfamily